MTGIMEDGHNIDEEPLYEEGYLFLQWYFEAIDSIVVIEEHHHALYAYLLPERHKIERDVRLTSDVWLHNTDFTPATPAWLIDKGRSAPYPNSKDNVHEKQIIYGSVT